MRNFDEGFLFMVPALLFGTALGLAFFVETIACIGDYTIKNSVEWTAGLDALFR